MRSVQAMTRKEKQERITELLDNYWFGHKMINRGEATQEELQVQFDGINSELERLGYYGKGNKGQFKG